MSVTKLWPKERTPRQTKSPYTSGFCSAGQCEGRKPVSRSGLGLPTCMMTSDQCKCKCHADTDRLFKMMDMPRPLPEQNPLYKPQKLTAWMPSLEERAAEHAAAVAARNKADLIVIESPKPTHVPATVTRRYSATPTGRAGRGELEVNVKHWCDRWVLDQPEESCTPTWISEKIAHDLGIKPPSVGAIGAVFDRWTAYGFALIGKKPVRFIGYTNEGVELGLEALKMRHRQRSKK